MPARVARQEIVSDTTAQAVFSFVQRESTPRRPIGGKMVMRGQLERLLEVCAFRNVDLQVLPRTTTSSTSTTATCPGRRRTR
ncbi:MULTISPECIES: Scr1 family TA system antitoxin-like transcriptional regulator [unclassified Streptomyces]|uniref:Scr1 family TA system antitoxin-like transcriptional regulator n=1 Tax=unclassified Streptomyces TaxID=2593676 RepID=UPI002D21E9C8|nr:Scr1 family TA system antitoxin-like transcriptional regulator [Streptomyces sp. NRRL F-2305]